MSDKLRTENELASAALAGDRQAYDTLKERMTELAVKIASLYTPARSIPRAMNTFDRALEMWGTKERGKEGYRFSTYFTHWLKSSFDAE